MKIYLLYEQGVTDKMALREVKETKDKFVEHARGIGKSFTFDILAGEPGHIYRAGTIFDADDEIGEGDSLPIVSCSEFVIGNLIGTCVDLTKWPEDKLDRVTFMWNTEK